MADAELHIVIKQAGDPEKLGALLNAAIDMKEGAVKVVIPVGYRCQECWRDDGRHDSNCALASEAKIQAERMKQIQKTQEQMHDGTET